MIRFQLYTFLVLAALVLAFSAPAAVYASETEQVSVVIPVTYTADNVSVSLQCKLEYEENEGQTVSNDTLNLKDGEEGSFTITYTVPGTYFYQLRQVKGTTDNVAYDEHIIYVTVYVTTDDAGKLYADVVLYEDGSDKLPSAYFINREETPVTPTSTSTSSSSSSSSESSVISSDSSVITTTPEPSAVTYGTGGTDSVKTADDTPSAEPYVVLMLLAAFAVPAVLILRKEDVK